MEIREAFSRFGSRQTPKPRKARPMNIPRMTRSYRRYLIKLGRSSGDVETAARFHAVAKLGLGRSSVQVANDLDIARSTVVTAAHR
jgi:hypothetical protein